MVSAPCPKDVLRAVAWALSDGQPHVVLERLPRGGGGTRWWVIRSGEEFRRVYAELRPGGRVHLVALGDDLRLGSVGTMLAEEVDSLTAGANEVVIGTGLLNSLEFDVQLLDSAEAAEALGRMAKSSVVLHGVWPRTERIKFTPPDEDGEVRPQPV